MPGHTLCGRLIMRFELVMTSRILIMVKTTPLEVIEWTFLQFYLKPDVNGYCRDSIMELGTMELYNRSTADKLNFPITVIIDLI